MLLTFRIAQLHIIVKAIRSINNISWFSYNSACLEHQSVSEPFFKQPKSSHYTLIVIIDQRGFQACCKNLGFLPKDVMNKIRSDNNRLL